MSVKICAHCGSSTFNVQTIRNAIVRMDIAADGVSVSPVIVSEEEGIVGIQNYSCSCGHVIVDAGADLVDAIECTSCGILTPVSEVDLDGKCQVCANPRPELQGLSETAYIRRILELEKQLKAVKHTGDAEAQEMADQVGGDQVV